MLTFEQIKELIELVSQRRLQGLEIERSGFRLSIDGQTSAKVVAAEATPAAPAAIAAPAPAAVAAPAAPATEEPAEDSGGVPDDAHIITSPIVGTFYRSPSPDSEPFADTGTRVEKGQVLCIVEAMKLMNEIESDAAGTVIEIFPKNGQPVEFGEPLFALKSE